jgi:hypothetical protein
MDVEATEARSPLLLRTALGFVLPLLILAATWNILRQHGLSPLELQHLVVDASGASQSAAQGLGLLAWLGRLGFLDLPQGLQLELILGVYALGLVAVGLIALRRDELPLSRVAPALALYSLLPWFLRPEDGVFAVAGLLLFPIGIPLRAIARGAPTRLLPVLGIILGLLFAFAGRGGVAFLTLAATGAMARPRGDSVGRNVMLLLPVVIAAATLRAFTAFEDLAFTDLWLDLRQPFLRGEQWILFFGAGIFLPGLFSFARKQLAPSFLALAALGLGVAFAALERSELADLQRRYARDRVSLQQATQGLQVGFPWIVVNLPLHLRPVFATAVPPVQWGQVTMLSLADNGEQIFVPKDLRFEEWFATLRYGRQGIERMAWGDLLLYGAWPRVMGPEHQSGLPRAYADRLRMGEVADARSRTTLHANELVVANHSNLLLDLQLDLQPESAAPIRVVLLDGYSAIRRIDGFYGQLQASWSDWQWRARELPHVLGAGQKLDSGSAKVVGFAPGLGPILELSPGPQGIRGQLQLTPRFPS